MTQLQQLYRLQQLDTDIQQQKKRLMEVYSAQKETPELLRARQRAISAETELSRVKAKQTELNLELGSVEEKAKRSEQRLYSGKVTNPKELSDLQNEIAALGRRRESIEEEMLETMIELEDAETEGTASAEALKTIENSWKTAQAAYKKEQDALAVEIKGKMQTRATLAARIDASLLKEYDDLRSKKSGVGIAKVSQNRCSACRITLSTHVLRQVERGDKVTCGGCGRLLTLPV